MSARVLVNVVSGASASVSVSCASVLCVRQVYLSECWWTY